MPKKSKLQVTKDLSPPSPPPPEHDLPYRTAESDRAFSPKSDHVTTSQRPYNNTVPQNRLLDEELTRDVSLSPPSVSRPLSLLDQLPHGFASSRMSQPLDIRDSLAQSEKVSDQGYTPPSETWLKEEVYSKSPQAPATLSPGLRQSPQPGPGFSKRNSFTSRTPPVSPLQRHVRPVSYAGGIPPVPSIPQFPPSNYGSPPAPYLPQQHFYGAPDVDLGLQKHSRMASAEVPDLAKFVTLPLVYNGSKQGFILGVDQRLMVFGYDGTKSSQIGTLNVKNGAVSDACFLTWTSGQDPYKHLRPLIAVVSFGEQELAEPTTVDEAPVRHSAVCHYTTRVEVYSLRTNELISELLHTQPIAYQTTFSGQVLAKPVPVGNLKLLSSGNFFMISSGTSGEVFVFGVDHRTENATFACLTKLWTSPQPYAARRESTHKRPNDESTPSEQRRSRHNEDVPMIATCGRWLAISPPTDQSRQALGFRLGEMISVRKGADFDALNAPPKPSISCEVDSPDADTLLSKMARGVAQEVIKGAKWLGDQGLQAWQNYWKRDISTSPVNQPQTYPSQYAATAQYGMFPPTHADASIQQSREPELVSIYDLKMLEISDTRKSHVVMPLATFQPPRGCSFISFAPSGLNLLTASRRGDFQYVWDLLQIQYPRATHLAIATDSKQQSCVRQLARYERLSGTIIVDVAWDTPCGTRFAVLTRNKTIHLFDLPAIALRWPPPRMAKVGRTISTPVDGSQRDNHETSFTKGFFGPAINLAEQTQPILANLRGRAPSAGSGFAGIGSTGIGIASATRARGSKAVATGLSKSLGAASDTVSRLQQAYESRKHLKHTKEAISGRLVWLKKDSTVGICVLEDSEARFFPVRKTRSRDQRQRVDNTVFDARKSIGCKLNATEINATTITNSEEFWKLNSTSTWTTTSLPHPLSYAEIETNAPYQPFHSDRRVTMSIYNTAITDDNQLPTASVLVHANAASHPRDLSSDQWVFGNDIPSTMLHLNNSHLSEDDSGSVIYRETTMLNENETEQIVSTTRRKKQGRAAATGHNGSRVVKARDEDVEDNEEGFFEDDCDVLDFATNRV